MLVKYNPPQSEITRRKINRAIDAVARLNEVDGGILRLSFDVQLRTIIDAMVAGIDGLHSPSALNRQTGMHSLCEAVVMIQDLELAVRKARALDNEK